MMFAIIDALPLEDDWAAVKFWTEDGWLSAKDGTELKSTLTGYETKAKADDVANRIGGLVIELGEAT